MGRRFRIPISSSSLLGGGGDSLSQSPHQLSFLLHSVLLKPYCPSMVAVLSFPPLSCEDLGIDEHDLFSLFFLPQVKVAPLKAGNSLPDKEKNFLGIYIFYYSPLFFFLLPPLV